MNKIFQWIGKIGENANLIAFMAHSGVAAYLVSRFPVGAPRFIAAAIALVVAGIKEFFLDLKYEKTPPQTLKDSALDFMGYITGIVAGTFIP